MLDNSKENPFPNTNSGYGRFLGGKLVSVYPEGSPMQAFHETAHDSFYKFVKDPTFPCVFGLAAVNIRQYAFNAYGDMRTKETAEGVLHDIVRYQNEFEVPETPKLQKGILRTFLAAFQTPQPKDQLEGSEALYTLMANMHELNSQHYPWPEKYSRDVDSNTFGFAAGRSAHFIAHFYPQAPVPARVSPDLHFAVFNSHAIVEAYKEEAGMDKHARAKALIRSRQSYVHPALGNFGDTPDFPQYTLLDTDPDTQAKEKEIRTRILGECPFKP